MRAVGLEPLFLFLVVVLTAVSPTATRGVVADYSDEYQWGQKTFRSFLVH